MLSSQVHHPKSYVQYAIKGLKSKNTRSQAVCLQEVSRCVGEHGVDGVLSAKQSKPVVQAVDSRDKDVRNAALDAIQVCAIPPFISDSLVRTGHV